MFNPADRPGHLARWIADATRDTEGHEIEKCPHPCSYCADRVAVEQFQQLVKTITSALDVLCNTELELTETGKLGYLLPSITASANAIGVALKAVQGE